MTHQEEYEFCKTIAGAAGKYNLFSFTLGPELELIDRLEDDMVSDIRMKTADAIVTINKIFLMRSLNELICDETPGADHLTEFFSRVKETFEKLSSMIKECSSNSDDMYDAIDDAETCKVQHEFLSKNTKGEIKLMHELILFYINYLLEKYNNE